MSKKKLCLALLSISMLAQQLGANFAANRMGRLDERRLALKIRRASAIQQTILRPYNDMLEHVNPDEENVPNYAGSFTKLFSHDHTTSVPDAAGQAAFEQLVEAMKTDKQTNFNAIEFYSGTERVLINPQAGFAYGMAGCDSSLFIIPAPPTLASAQAAADMIETYLNAICRDVKFEEYGTGEGSDAISRIRGIADISGIGEFTSITDLAAAILDALGDAYIGPRNSVGRVDASVLFRGGTAGDLVGPYISQFLLKPLPLLFPAGCAGFVASLIGVQNLPTDVLVHKQLRPIAGKREFGVSWDDFVAIQNGLIPKVYASTDYDADNLRYPITGRDMGSFVHYDGPYEPYYNALVILAANGFPISPVFPYANGAITKESAGFNMGVPDAFALVGGVCLEAFKAAWAQKWRCYRRLRPEAMAGLVHYAKTSNTNPYNLHSSLFATYDGVEFLELVKEHNALQALSAYDPQQLLTLEQASTYLLSQMYPEGSPAHPAYPSGHATAAGACTTVIKAIFDDQYLIKNKFAPVKVDPTDPTKLIALSGEGEDDMTVGGELNKLASNMAIARNFAGVHYRWDGEYGIQLGEQVAIRYLQDHARTYPEEGFTGFELTKRDGTRIRITPDDIVVIG